MVLWWKESKHFIFWNLYFTCLTMFFLHHYIINDLFDGVKASQNRKHHSFLIVYTIKQVITLYLGRYSRCLLCTWKNKVNDLFDGVILPCKNTVLFFDCLHCQTSHYVVSWRYSRCLCTWKKQSKWLVWWCNTTL